MDEQEAWKLLCSHLNRYRQMSYADLSAQMTGPISLEIQQPDSGWYQIEIEILMDDPSTGNFRVIGSIDDGGWRAFFPLSEDFIMAPDGSFIGE